MSAATFSPDRLRAVLRMAGWAGLAALAGLMPTLAADGVSGVLATGRTLGLWALLLLMLQPVTALRLRWLDRAFGQDRLIAFHRSCGAAALGLAFLHPLVVYGPGLPSAGPIGWNLWREGLGAVAWLAVWLVVVSSLGRCFLLLSWGAWRRLHLAAGLVLGAGLAHGLTLAYGLRSGWRLAVCAALLAGWAAVLLRFRVFRPVRACAVTGVRRVAAGVTELTLAPDDGRGFDFLPGQFVFLRLRSAAVPDEEHPFTVASAAGWAAEIRLAVKAVGDYTGRLGDVRVGEQAVLQGPFGGFTPSRFGGAVERLVLVAGGIGVTPLLSVVRTLAARRESVPVTLIGSSHTAADLPYRDEIEALRADWPGLTVHWAFTREKGGERLDSTRLHDWAPPYQSGTQVMVCGPEGMMRSVSHALRTLGYPRRVIHSERFGL